MSLLDQKPESIMAKKWCVEHGTLDPETATAYIREIQSVMSNTSSKQAPRQKASKPVIINDIGGDTGFKEGGVEGIGSSSFA